MMRLTLFLVLVVSCLSVPALGCGYATCPTSYDTSKVQIHIIAHSHDDVGWLKTADGYAEEDVRHVLDNVVSALKKNPKRKFVEVEMYYFSRWWQGQSKATQETVHALVKSGQLAFANGGWCVNDEAAAHYSNIIDQMTLGIAFLTETFGDCAQPKVSWQVDPFGASREMANLYAMMDFDGHIVNRGNNLHGEFMWNASNENAIFTSTLHNHYSAPNGFNFEDADSITLINKHEKGKILAELGKKWNTDYGNRRHVLMTFGDDFKYQHAERYYSNLDALIEVVNKEHSDVNLFYSSPHCYVKAIRDSKPQLEVRTHDYFPLWTGYYSSRPEVKYLDRWANNLLQTAKQMEVLAGLNDTQSYVYEAKNQLAVLQHHDAIPGTSKPLVMLDYKERLTSAILASQTVISKALEKLTRKSATKGALPYVYTSVNVSQLGVTFDSPTLASIIYNPIAHPTGVWVRIPVGDLANYRVYDSEGKEVTTVSHVPLPGKVRAMVGHAKSTTHELVFNATLPPLGFTTYFLTKDSANRLSETKAAIPTNANKDLLLKGKNFQLIVDSKTGQVKGVVKGGSNKEHRLVQTFQYYPSDHSSSSYEFCPTGGAVDLTDYSSTLVSAVQYTGFAEVTQQVNDWVWQTVRVYEDKEYAEFDWIVGPVGDKPKVGKDVITRFDSDLATSGTFYTDANGRQDIQRQRDEEPRSCMGTRNAISYNYYPATSRSLLKDPAAGLTLALLTDRSVGAASLADGQIELMIHRRLFDTQRTDIPVDDLDTDGNGVVARGKVYLFLNDKSDTVDNYRQKSQAVFMAPIMGLTPVTTTVQQYRADHQVTFTGLKAALPENVHLLTLENWGHLANNEVLVRLENFYQTHQESVLAPPRPIETLDIFSTVPMKTASQANLIVGARKAASANTTVNLGPSQIGTFLYSVNRSLGNTGCLLRWQKRVNGKLPAGAILGGHEVNGGGLNICRHKDVDLIPGKYSDQIKCLVGYGGHEKTFNDDAVEILTGPSGSYEWVPRHGGDPVSSGAFVAGQTATGLSIHLGRCETPHRGEAVGKIDKFFYYTFGGKEYRDCANHQILVC